MIERADQLVLNYVSKAADAAHGVLRADQRLDFARRLRARIETERGGSQDARQVARVLARFGDPVDLVEREARRLAEAGVSTARDTALTRTPPTRGSAPSPLAAPTREIAPTPLAAPTREAAPSPLAARTPAEAAGDATRRLPAVVDEREAPPGVRVHRRLPEEHLAQERGYGLPFAGLRRVAMARANPMATGGRDARTIVKEHPRDAAAIVILVAAALLVPFHLAPLAIFPVPVVVWALGAALVLFSESWNLRDKLLGIGAPMLGYSVGGVLVGGLRVGVEAGWQPFIEQFFDVSGTMFMIGTGLGVVWLAYRLLALDER
ncbi:hypothetical protein AB0K18_20980 [Nonomuraea sp. NPDC049421]|uniref:hypothetical protein n=1 Tax=Nonomuraea sp. NPDC049421 TaxID=3155275 RepID=UPI003446D692